MMKKRHNLFNCKQLNKEFLYINSLSSGVGNNDIGLDRGQLGNERIVYFSKSGNKLLLIQQICDIVQVLKFIRTTFY